jgi:hypothetical protein
LHIGFALGNVALERQVGAGPVLESAVCVPSIGASPPARITRPSTEYRRTRKRTQTTLLQRSPQSALSRPAMPLVAEQMDLVAAGGLRIVERDVGFGE